jgi:hypothetical protein
MANPVHFVASVGPAQYTWGIMVKEAAITITLDIRPETQDELARQAAAQGLDIGAYAANLLEEAAHAASVKPTQSTEAKDMVELFAPLRGLNLDFERDRDTGRDINL